MTLTTGLALIACALGAGLGLKGLLDPAWAGRLLRLRDDPERPGGAAEFRATFGGLFLAAHAVLAYFLVVGPAPMGQGGAAVLACAWIGTAIGRGLSIALDPPSRTGFNAASTAFEIVVGLLLAAPLLVG
ncbi:MAG: DUF4345 family protein [Caulobacterales bacterium]